MFSRKPCDNIRYGKQNQILAKSLDRSFCLAGGSPGCRLGLGNIQGRPYVSVLLAAIGPQNGPECVFMGFPNPSYLTKI